MGTALVYGLGGYYVITGAFTIGTIVAFGSYLDQLYGALQGLTGAPVSFSTSMVSFERVFETKALSAFVLAQALPEFLKTLRFVAFFTSVAGAFSNRGQADYVAGNEVANKIV